MLAPEWQVSSITTMAPLRLRIVRKMLVLADAGARACVRVAVGSHVVEMLLLDRWRRGRPGTAD